MADTKDLKSFEVQPHEGSSPSSGTILRRYKKQAWQYNRCSYCGKFKPWKDLALKFVPDTEFSSESESSQACYDCLRRLEE